MRDHRDSVSVVCWSPDDRKVLSCGNDNMLKVWNVATGECIKSIDKHTEAVTACAWLPCGQKFISGSFDKSVYIWVYPN